MSNSEQRRGLVIAAVGLGSNVGEREVHLEAGFAGLAALPRTSLIGRSSVFETEPVVGSIGPAGQDAYCNAAALIATRLPAAELLGAMLSVEGTRGRDRDAEVRWGPRTLDLDLLLYGDEVINEPGLTVPHPRMADRAFVLEPLAEIAGDLVVPGLVPALGKASGATTVGALWSALAGVSR